LAQRINLKKGDVMNQLARFIHARQKDPKVTAPASMNSLNTLEQRTVKILMDLYSGSTDNNPFPHQKHSAGSDWLTTIDHWLSRNGS
jgi:hypothetical protein